MVKRDEGEAISRTMTSVFAGDTKISEISLRLGIRVDLTRRSREERDAAHVYYNLLSLSLGRSLCARQMVPAGWRIKAENLPRPKRGSAHGIARETRASPRRPSRYTNTISEYENSIKFHVMRLRFRNRFFYLNVHVYTLMPHYILILWMDFTSIIPVLIN